MKKLVKVHTGKTVIWGHLSNEMGGLVKECGGIFPHLVPLGTPLGHLEELTLLPPCSPRTVLGIAYNYVSLVSNSGRSPLLFAKTVDSICDEKSPIEVSLPSQSTWVEVELAIVLKASIYRASIDEAKAAILGFTIANDVTTRVNDEMDHHLIQSKGRHTYCPIGSILHCGADTHNLRLTTTINGIRTQVGNTSERVLNDAECLAFASQFVRLYPGDILLTGTPKGAENSSVVPGDSVQLEIQSIGRLDNPIVCA